MTASQTIHVHNLLANHPFFSLLGDKERARCAATMQGASYRVGETIFHAGQEGDAACFLVEGKVRIVRNGAQAGISLGTFRPGAFFAAHARCDQWYRTTSCRAAEDAQLLHLPRCFVEELLDDHSELRPYLDKTIEESVLLETLSLARLLAAVPGSEIIDAIDALEPATFGAGELVIRQGDFGDAMYVLRRGKLEVRQRFPDGERRLRELLPGDYFGERALVLDDVRSTTVAALDACECFRLDRRSFDRLRDRTPSFTKQMLAKFSVYETTEMDVSQHADVFLVPLLRTDLAGRDASESARVSAIGSGLPQHHLLKLLELTEFAKGLAAGSVAVVLSCLKCARFERGTRLPDDSLCIVRSGSVRGRRSDRTPIFFAKGETFGAARSAEVLGGRQFVASADVELLILDARALDFLAMTVPDWQNHLRRLAEREAALQAATPEHVSKASGDALPLKPRHDSLQAGPASARRGPRWIGQSSPNSCGLAALAMVLHAHGMSGDYAELKRRYGLLPRGLTILQMRRIAESLGFTVDVVETGVEELGVADLPAIALWENEHYVVLFRIGNSTCLVGDPAVGLVKMSHTRLQESWGGRLLRLQPASQPAALDTGTIL